MPSILPDMPEGKINVSCSNGDFTECQHLSTFFLAFCSKQEVNLK